MASLPSALRLHFGSFECTGFLKLEAATAIFATDNSEHSPWWVLGIGLMVVGTIASSIGMLCFKRAGTVTAPWYRNGWFWAGVLLFVVTAAVVDTIVFAVTPLGLIAPFAGLTIVISFMLATLGCCGVKEPATKTAATAVLLIVLGVTVCSIAGPKTDGSITPQEMRQSFERCPWLYTVCAVAAPSFLAFYAVSVGYPHETRTLLRSWIGALVLALSAAGFGAVTQLQFKALASAILEALQAIGSTDSPPSATIARLYGTPGEFVTQLLCVGSSGLAQIGFLNFAISGAPVAYTVPAYQSALLMLTLSLSGFVLDEYENVPPLDLSLFWIAALIIVCGMLLNAWGLSRAARAGLRGDDDDDDETLGSIKHDALPGAIDPEAADAARRAASAKYGR